MSLRPRKKLTQFMSRAFSGAGRPQDVTVSRRNTMVVEQIEARGVNDTRVLDAMRKVPRHRFVPADLQDRAHNDGPLPIGYNQTISQPFIVGSMTASLNLSRSDKVLEIGTGCGYQAAVLAEVAGQVYTVETVETFALQSAKLLKEMGYKNVFVRHGDGYNGWPEAAPFDAIIVTAAPEEVPATLVEQLKPGGRMVIPVGSEEQTLLRITKTPDGIKTERLYSVRFVPMVKEK